MRSDYLPVLGLFAAMQVACVPDPVMPTMSEDSHIPAITAERVQACMSEYGKQLDGYSYGVRATVQVDQDGRTVNVELEGMPSTAPDLAACTRIALRDMAVPDWVFRVRQAEPLVSEKQTPAARSMNGNVLVLGGAIAIGELIAKAFGVTLIFAVAVELVDAGIEAGKSYIQRRRECDKKNTECLMTDLADIKDEDLLRTTRCAPCTKECMKTGEWPSTIELADKRLSCEYWKPRWERNDGHGSN